MGAVTGPPGEAVEVLYDPHHRCSGRAAGCCFRNCIAPRLQRPGGKYKFIEHEKEPPLSR